jgi:hypothetical protein
MPKNQKWAHAMKKVLRAGSNVKAETLLHSWKGRLGIAPIDEGIQID